MKYKKVKEVISNAGCDRIMDNSPPGNVHAYRPLWIVLEHKIVGLRVWVTHSFGQLEISTARLDLDVKSEEYERSRRRYLCKNQADMAEKLEVLLKQGMI